MPSSVKRDCPLTIDSLKDLVKRNQGIFKSQDNLQWSWAQTNAKQGNINTQWISSPVDITSNGELVSPVGILINSLQNCSLKLYNNLIIQITSSEEDGTRRLLVKSTDLAIYQELLSCLVVWSRLNSNGLLSKWNFNNSIADKKKVDELLICRFKVYGPISPNQKVKFEEHPRCPIYPLSLAGHGIDESNRNNANGSTNNATSPSSANSVKEGWFTAMGYLGPDGKLDLLRESDGSKFYQLNISKLFDFEIRELNNSLFQNSNILFLGFINDIRKSYQKKNETSMIDKSDTLISVDSSGNSNSHANSKLKCNRILLQFDLRIDLEDWLVTMKSFAKREYLGNPLLSQRLRMTKTCKVEIIESLIKNSSVSILNENTSIVKYLYAELIMWNAPWCRTSIVETYNGNCFWKEEWDLELPSFTDYFKINIKTARNKNDYRLNDTIVGTVFITPDMINGNSSNHTGSNTLSNFKVNIYNPENEEFGSLMINLKMSETKILSPYTNYKFFERMLINTPIQQVIKFIQPLVTSVNLQEYSNMLLDIYQTLNMEHEFFTELSEIELTPIDSMIRKNRIKQATNGASATSNNGINTIFRGNSILSKSLEKYALRVGQEYLEKLLKDFISQIANDGLSCEVDPRFIDIEDPNEKKLVLEKNLRNLNYYIRTLWKKIYTTSNDLPIQLKEEWSKLRTQIELSVEPTDTETPLNGLTSFIFLRFLCPAILNPKLFHLSQDHQDMRTSRTLTLLAKILMTLSNRSEFPKHKEVFLLPLNEFINGHKDELLIYLDRVTNRKMDFNERILEMSDKIDRPSLNLPIEIVNELPTMPYLIDKYYRMVQFLKILDSNNKNKNEVKFNNNRNVRILNDDNLKLSLEFEILNFDDTDFGSEEFLKNLLKSGSSNNIRDQLTNGNASVNGYDRNSNGLLSDSDLDPSISLMSDGANRLSLNDDDLESRHVPVVEFNDSHDEEVDKEVINSLKTEIKLKELMDQSSIIMKKTTHWENSMTKAEVPRIFSLESWTLFIDDLFKRLVTDSKSNVLFIGDVSYSDASFKTYVDFNESLQVIYKSFTVESSKPAGLDSSSSHQVRKSESLHSLQIAAKHSGDSNGSGSKGIKIPFRRIFGKKK